MEKKIVKKLVLSKETVRGLEAAELREVAGGFSANTAPTCLLACASNGAACASAYC
jgi:hypothetical protein